MNANLWTQLLIAIVPALITGAGSLIIAIKKCKNVGRRASCPVSFHAFVMTYSLTVFSSNLT